MKKIKEEIFYMILTFIYPIFNIEFVYNLLFEICYLLRNFKFLTDSLFITKSKIFLISFSKF